MRAASSVSDVKREVGAEDFHTISTDTHIDDLVIKLAGADKKCGCDGAMGGRRSQTGRGMLNRCCVLHMWDLPFVRVA